MIEASIDIGTNTILLLIADLQQEEIGGGGATDIGFKKIARVIHDSQTIVRLGQGVSRNGFFLPEAMDRAYRCLMSCKDICEREGVSVIRAVATSASRDARNSAEFYDRIRQEIGIDVRIIPGHEEAHLGFFGGLMPHQDPAQAVLIDIGGGSTEFVTDVSEQSVDIGSVRATEMFLQGEPYSKEALRSLEVGVKAFWPTLDGDLQVQLRDRRWTGVAGTVTTLAAIHQNLTHFDPVKIDGYQMNRSAIRTLYDALAHQTMEERAANPVIGEGRADVIAAGAAILHSAMEYFGKDDIVVSTRGLRYGVLLAGK